MFCENCKQPLADNSTFCPFCGTEQHPQKEDNIELKTKPKSKDSSHEKTCPYCGEMISELTSVCPHRHEVLVSSVRYRATSQMENLDYTRIWINLNLWVAKIIAAGMVFGFWKLYIYISDHINPEYISLPTLWGIWSLGVCLTLVVIVLNVIATIMVNQGKG